MEFGLSALREQVPPIPKTRPSAPPRPDAFANPDPNREINQAVAVDTTPSPVEPRTYQSNAIRLDAQGNRVGPSVPPVPQVRPSVKPKSPSLGGRFRDLLGRI